METTGDWENWFRHVGKNWDNVLIASTGPRGDPTLNGLSIGEAAARRNVRPWDLFFDLVQESDAFVCPRSMDEEQKRLALGAPFVAIDTDAAPINPASVATGLAQSFHPRALGTFPRVLARYVREEKVLPLEEAIRRMSSLAANRLKLLDRGRIAPGMKADVVIFDANRIQDTATFTRPLSYPEGIEYVLVNGKLAIDGAKATGVLAGTVIRNRR
jgi:N-acyl-D-aspartate/D-glutamate deacylase